MKKMKSSQKTEQLIYRHVNTVYYARKKSQNIFTTKTKEVLKYKRKSKRKKCYRVFHGFGHRHL